MHFGGIYVFSFSFSETSRSTIPVHSWSEPGGALVPKDLYWQTCSWWWYKVMMRLEHLQVAFPTDSVGNRGGRPHKSCQPYLSNLPSYISKFPQTHFLPPSFGNFTMHVFCSLTDFKKEIRSKLVDRQYVNNFTVYSQFCWSLQLENKFTFASVFQLVSSYRVISKSFVLFCC